MEVKLNGDVGSSREIMSSCHVIMSCHHVNTRTAARVTVAVEFADAAVVAGAFN